MNRTRADFDDSVRRGARWALLTQLGGQLLSFVALAVLCRFVAPAQFGVFSTALLVVTLPRVFATAGFGVAIVQHGELRPEQLSTLFWLNMATGLVCGVISAAAGWGLAWWGDARLLATLTFALAGTSVVAALGTTHQALLERRLALPLVQRARIAAQLAGAIAGIGGALLDWQAWALVAQQYVELSVLALLAWRRDAWRPSWNWRRHGLEGLVRFGSLYSLSNLVFYVGQNSDKLWLYLAQGSTVAGQAALGMYSLAFNLMMKPVYLVTTPLTAVMLPALSRSAGDPGLYAQLVARFMRMCGILLLPAGAGLFVVAPDAAAVLAGEDWGATGTLLRALAPVVLVQGFINICGTLLASAGKSGRLLAGAVVTSLVLLQGIAAGYWLGERFGEEPDGPTAGVAWAVSLATTLAIFLPYLAYCLAQVAIPLRSVLTPLRGAALASAGMCVLVATAQRAGLGHDSIPAAARLVLQVALGAVSYAWLARREVRWLLAELRESRGE